MTLLRSVGNSRVPLLYDNFRYYNVLMDLLFVFRLHNGVFGAALATVLAQVLSALYCCYYIERKKIDPEKTGLETTGCDHQNWTLVLSPVAVMEFVTAGRNGVVDICQQYGNKLCGCLCGMHQDPRSFEQPATVKPGTLTFCGTELWCRKGVIRTGIREGVILIYPDKIFHWL